MSGVTGYAAGLEEDAAALWVQIDRNLGGLPFHRLGVAASREVSMVDYLPPGPEMAEVTDIVAVVGDASVGVRVYQPCPVPAGPAVLYVHGGGWSIGSVDGADAVCRWLSFRTGATVVSVDYRQAPEHPYPAAFDDVWTAWQWLASDAHGMAIDPARLALAGDSAGANLAAAVALRVGIEGGPRVAAQVLVYPALNDSLTHPSYRTHATAPLLTTEDVRWFWDLYLQGVSRPRPVFATPATASDLSGLPPTAVLTAEHDPVRDDGEEFARQIRAVGGEVRVKRYRGVYHGFFGFPGLLARADEALRDVADYLQEVFHVPV